MVEDELTISLRSLVGELVLAWQKLAMYQQGHPARRHAVRRAHAVLAGLIAPAGNLSLGVSQDGLLGPEEKLTSAVAARLAAALYGREVAVLRFEEGVEAEELERLLELLPRHGVYREDQQLGDELAALGVRHVVVEPVDFTGLVATDSLDAAAPAPGSLWDRIIQRLLQDQQLSAARALLEEPGDDGFQKVLAVVSSLMERYGAPLGDAVTGEAPGQSEVLGALAGLIGHAISDQASEAVDREAERATSRHVAELLGALPAGFREGVLDAAVHQLATSERAAPGLRSLSGAVSAAQMVGSLRRLRAEKIAFSPTLVSLAESLVLEMPAASLIPPQPHEPEALARELRGVFADQDVDRSGHGEGFEDRLFLDLRHHVPIHSRFADLDPYLDTLTEDRETVLLSVTLTDLLRQPFFNREQVGWVVERQRQIFRTVLAGGRLTAATRMVESLRQLAASPESGASVREAAERCLEAFRQGDSLAAIVDTLGEVRSAALPGFQRLIELLGPQALRQLLLVLGDESDLSRRRRIFDLLVSLGPAVVAPAVALLEDPRWYMTRNILSLLRQVGEGIDRQVLFRGLGHADARVRLEAVKCLPELERAVSPELVERLLGDADPKVAEAAVATLGRAKIAAASEPLVQLLQRRDPLGRQKRLRLKALAALGEIGDPAVLPRIGHCFRSWFAVVTHEERHAAFESLRLYPPPARRPWLRKGRRAPDATVRELCRQLAADAAPAAAAPAPGAPEPGAGR